MKRTTISVIVPTLNEEKNIESLLKSLKNQGHPDFEIIVVDGGSRDKTVEVASRYGAKTVVLHGCGEFPSRNVGASLARGEILLFTSADVKLPRDLLEKVHEKIDEDHRVIAVFGPSIPYDSSLIGKFEYIIYNVSRFVLAKLLKRFSTSTNLLAIRKEAFEKIGGFDSSDINADGLLGRRLLEMTGNTEFCFDVYVFISARRMKNMGFLKFNIHYLYVLENFFPSLSRTNLIKNLKQRSREIHHPPDVSRARDLKKHWRLTTINRFIDRTAENLSSSS